MENKSISNYSKKVYFLFPSVDTQWQERITTISFWLNTNNTQQLNQLVLEGEGLAL